METRYKINFKNSCSKACDFCPDFGALSTHNLSTLDTNRIKAKSCGYSSLVIPCNFDFSSKDKNLIHQIKSDDQKIIQQIHIDNFLKLDEKDLNQNTLQIVSDDYLRLLKAEPFALSQVQSFLFVVKKSNYKKILKHWFKVSAKIRNKIKFYFTQKDKSEVGYLSCNQIYNFRKNLSKVDPNINDQQFVSDFDLFEPRVAIDMDLEGDYQPIFTHKTEPVDIKLSIIIPSYNNKDEVLQTIKFLNTQNLPKNQYELICVDDGSTDKTTSFIQENFKKLGYSVNFKLIRYPRIIPRSPGDKRFRAGLARNVGSKHATGKYLMFCDADIVFLKTSLETVLEELQTHDVIQIQRHYLNEGVKTSQLYRSDFDIEQNTFHPNNGYWKDFYDNGDNWMEYKAPWKYICTFGLALKREDFINSGRFRKVFLNYGFEDTDLGYRLFKMGKSFKLSSVKAYHQFGKFERNEYAHSSFKRHNLLSTTAKIFYRHYADPDIFEELPSFLRV